MGWSERLGPMACGRRNLVGSGAIHLAAATVGACSLRAASRRAKPLGQQRLHRQESRDGEHERFEQLLHNTRLSMAFEARCVRDPYHVTGVFAIRSDISTAPRIVIGEVGTEKTASV